MRTLYPEYDVNYISGCMSLRPPQKRSLKILDDILDEIGLSKNQDLDRALATAHDLFPTCKNFERNFMSLTFALATGVGKTRLMGAFITYLYSQKGIKNFFVVAPNLTIYEKLKKDLGDPSNEKYVFRGIGCFAQIPPNIITGENYAEKGQMYGFSEVTINVFNISKFNRELGKIRDLSEYLGTSYFDFLASRDDLVVIMDESHHYRADKGLAAINELKPVLGLELTATPQAETGAKTIKFKNVVYEYPLSSAIRDGYTKIPYAMTRRDIEVYNFGEEDLDKMMLTDGIRHHEKVKVALLSYAANSGNKRVKPFVLVVCQNTEHAEFVQRYIKSEEFFDGKYKDKTIIVHSNQKGSEREDSVRKLLAVEDYDNPVEIVIHVNILKEGWDVNNLYTIIPLRTAASQTLREQTIGRGLRLPYGQRTGNTDVDALVITAHNKFQKIIDEANKPDSLLKRGNIIYAEDTEETESVDVQPNYKTAVQQSLFDFGIALRAEGLDAQEVKAIAGVTKIAVDTLIENYHLVGKEGLTAVKTEDITAKAIESVDLGELVARKKDFTDIVRRFTGEELNRQRRMIESATMAIPQIKVECDMRSNYRFEPFALDLSELDGYAPILNEIEYRNLIKSNEVNVTGGMMLDFKAANPMKTLVNELREKPEIDYDLCSELLYDLLTSLLTFFAEKYTNDEIKNIVMCYKKDIANKVYLQMKKHFKCGNPGIIEQISGVGYTIYAPNIIRKKGQESLPLDTPMADGEVPKHVFTGFTKALHPEYKFDSNPERRFAIVCDSDPEVQKWLRPAPKQFNLFYGNGQRYEPDFVVETADTMYLVEVKGKDKFATEDNIAKKKRAVRYCELATLYCEAHHLKAWKHLYIPAELIQTNSSFHNLAARFFIKAETQKNKGADALSVSPNSCRSK